MFINIHSKQTFLWIHSALQSSTFNANHTQGSGCMGNLNDSEVLAKSTCLCDQMWHSRRSGMTTLHQSSCYRIRYNPKTKNNFQRMMFAFTLYHVPLEAGYCKPPNVTYLGRRGSGLQLQIPWISRTWPPFGSTPSNLWKWISCVTKPIKFAYCAYKLIWFVPDSQ